MTIHKSAASCADEYDPSAKTVDQALSYIEQYISPVTDTLSRPLTALYGFVLAEDIHSSINVPAYTNSAMDGYALRSEDISADSNTCLQLVGKAFAGVPFEGALENGQCIRIMTGAVIPDGADCVVMQEHVQTGEKDTDIIVPPGQSAGQNIRHAGEDVRQDETVFYRGHLIKPADVGVLAALGIAEAKVYRSLRVAVLSTGDELKQPGQQLEPGQLYDSNRYSLTALLHQPNIELRDFGIIPDQAELIRSAMLDAASWADVVITSGGVSVGEADYVRQTLEQIGKVNFWKIAMKPGRPLAYGKIGQAEFFGLPGNPVSAMATFVQFIRPALSLKSGSGMQTSLSLRLQTVSRLKKRPGRVEYQRGIIFTNELGQSVVKTTGGQGSHILSSMSKANCFIVLPLESAGADTGDWVEVQLFS